MTEASPLHGRRLLVIEDDYLVAATLADMLDAQGATVVGPVGSVQGAIDLIQRTKRLDGALLDIDLHGAQCYGVIETLQQLGVPCMFLSGYDADVVPHEYRGIPFLRKPLGSAQLADALQELVA
jgi:CheY-like chemotaxis protein